MKLPARINVIGSQVSRCDVGSALDLLEAKLDEGGGGYVCFTNVHATVTGRKDRQFQDITNGSFLSLADGKPVFWIGRAKGATDLGHVPGPDFMRSTLKRFPSRKHFFYGATPQVLAKLTASLALDIPGLNICGTFSPPFRPLTRQDKEDHYTLIRDSGAEFIWVGLGAPKQEQWMAEASPHLAPAILFGVGAAFDFHAGVVRRAPTAMGFLGLEWLYRLSQEPRRLWKRYLVTNSLFLYYVTRDFLKGCGITGNQA